MLRRIKNLKPGHVVVVGSKRCVVKTLQEIQTTVADPKRRFFVVGSYQPGMALVEGYGDECVTVLRKCELRRPGKRKAKRVA